MNGKLLIWVLGTLGAAVLGLGGGLYTLNAGLAANTSADDEVHPCCMKAVDALSEINGRLSNIEGYLKGKRE